eukprot:3788801-Pyramimonas_sp.AAC.1
MQVGAHVHAASAQRSFMRRQEGKAIRRRARTCSQAAEGTDVLVRARSERGRVDRHGPDAHSGVQQS